MTLAKRIDKDLKGNCKKLNEQERNAFRDMSKVLKKTEKVYTFPSVNLYENLGIL